MEDILNWHWWMYTGILLFIIEIFSLSFIFACLGIGAISAAIGAYLGYDLDAQLVVVAITTLVSLFLIRPLLYKKGMRDVDKIKTNTDALVGRIGLVTHTIDNANNKGRVSIDGDQWRAHALNNDIIEEHTQVEIVDIESTIVTVKKI